MPPSGGRMSSINLVIITHSVFFAVLSWKAAVANNATCCQLTDIPLTVDCTSVNATAQLRWESIQSSFGFNVHYWCDTNATVTNCDGVKKRFGRRDYNQNGNVYTGNIETPAFYNSTCWFWIENKDRLANQSFYCSELIRCNAYLPTADPVVTSSATSILLVLPSSVTPVSISSPSVASPSPTHSTQFTSTPPLSWSSSLSLSFSLTTLSSSLPVTTSSPSVSVSSTSQTTSAPSPTKSSSATTVNITSTAVAPQQSSVSTSPDLYSLLLYIILCFIAIFVGLVIMICLYVYWRKRDRKQFKSLVRNTDVKLAMEDTGDIPMESESETETIICKEDDCDAVTISDLDMKYMYEKILHSKPDDIVRRISLDSIFYTDSEADNTSTGQFDAGYDGIVGGSHYCYNNGSAGHCSNSNTSSSRHRSTSNSAAYDNT